MSERSLRIEKSAGISPCGIDLGTNASYIASRKRVERFGISANASLRFLVTSWRDVTATAACRRRWACAH